jgi:pimeloyl-ACP methyl ester carboxylesterase
MPCIDTGRVSLFFEDAGSGTPPVLLLHELGGCSESWRAVIALLAPDRRMIAVDMRCAGRSETRPGRSRWPTLRTISTLCCGR